MATIHPAVKWVPDIWTSWHHGCLTSTYNGNGVMLHSEWSWCMNVQVQSGGKVVWVGLAWNKTIHHDLHLYIKLIHVVSYPGTLVLEYHSYPVWFHDTAWHMAIPPCSIMWYMNEEMLKYMIYLCHCCVLYKVLTLWY